MLCITLVLRLITTHNAANPNVDHAVTLAVMRGYEQLSERSTRQGRSTFTWDGDTFDMQGEWGHVRVVADPPVVADAQ